MPFAETSPIKKKKRESGRNQATFATKDPSSLRPSCRHLQHLLSRTLTVFVNADLSWEIFLKSTIGTQPSCPHVPPTGEGISLLNPVHKVWKRLLFLHMQRHQCKPIRNVRNTGNMTPPKGNVFQVANSKGTGIYTVWQRNKNVLRKSSKLAENTNRQRNEIRETLHEQNEKLKRQKS